MITVAIAIDLVRKKRVNDTKGKCWSRCEKGLIAWERKSYLVSIDEGHLLVKVKSDWDVMLLGM